MLRFCPLLSFFHFVGFLTVKWMVKEEKERQLMFTQLDWMFAFRPWEKEKVVFQKSMIFGPLHPSRTTFFNSFFYLDVKEVLVLNAHFPISTSSIIDFNCFNKSLIILQRRVNDFAKLSVTFAFISWIQQVHTKCSNCILKPPQPLSHKLYTTCWACKSSGYSCILPIT